MIDSLNKRVIASARTRDLGSRERGEWSLACQEFHSKYAELFYPGGDANLDALKRGEPAAIQLGIDFLEADPRHFRSGYTKEEVWRRLRRTSLSSSDKARLEEVALQYLDRQISREFWSMARVISVIGSTKFWHRVREIAESELEPKRTRAEYLAAYQQGAAIGGRNRQRVFAEYLARKYRARQFP
jgi:hypothetical protein